MGWNGLPCFITQTHTTCSMNHSSQILNVHIQNRYTTHAYTKSYSLFLSLYIYMIRNIYIYIYIYICVCNIHMHRNVHYVKWIIATGWMSIPKVPRVAVAIPAGSTEITGSVLPVSEQLPDLTKLWQSEPPKHHY